jgi:multiple sugar transport system substrate-binding protein
MKKVLCLLGIAAMLLAGCGKQDSTNETSAEQAVQKTNSSASDTINVAIQFDVNTVKWFKEVKAAYEKAYPERKVKLEIISGTPQNYYTKLQLMLKSESNIDVVYEDSFMLQSDVSAGLLAPINQIKDWNQWKEFYSSLRDFSTIDDNVYGVSMSTDTRGLFYNVDMFKKAGITVPWQPKNWQDIIDACEAVKASVPGVFPITVTGSRVMGEGTTMQTLEMLLYGTENPLYKDGKWVVSSPGMLNSFKFLQTLAKKDLLPRLDILMNAQYGNMLQDQLAPQEKVAVILDGCWITGRWVKAHPETLKKYQLAMMPTEYGQSPDYVTMAGGWLLSVSNKSTKKDAAVDFIKFALNKQNVLNYVLMVNNLSVREDVAADPKYPEYLKPATKILKYAIFRPANEQYPIVSSKIQKAVESVLTQTATPVKAMKTLTADVKRSVGDKYIDVIK